MPRTSNKFSRLSRPILVGITALFLATSIFAQSGGFKGKIRNQGGKAIAYAEVEARQDGNVVKTARSNAKGEFLLSGLRAGKYNISFDAVGYATGVLFNVEVGDKVRELGEKLILAPDQGNIVFIRGSVFFKEGSSVTGAKIDLLLVNPDGSIKRLESSYTDIRGDFAFRRPPGAGTYRVNARLKDTTGFKDIVVENPAIYRTAITLNISRNDR